MLVTPNVRAVQVPDTSLMHPQYTTIYLVGKGQVLTIDSGEDSERYRWMIRGYLAATEKAEIGISVVSHHHRDHIGNLTWLRDEFRAEIYLSGLTESTVGSSLPHSGIHVLETEATIEVGGGVRLQVLGTPGHSDDSVCYYLEEEGVLFTGDTILGGSTTTITDLANYMESLERIRGLQNLKVICPGHGPLILEPQACIDDYIHRRLTKEQEVLALLAEGSALTSWAIVEKLYTEVDRGLWRAADRVVQAHLRKLQHDGRVRATEGKPRDLSVEESEEARKEEARRQAVIAQAEEYKVLAAKRALFLQENPATQQWLEAPVYELVD